MVAACHTATAMVLLAAQPQNRLFMPEVTECQQVIVYVLIACRPTLSDGQKALFWVCHLYGMEVFEFW